jgi:hypothetical protein
VAFVLAPGTHRTHLAGHVIIQSASRWPWAVAVACFLLAVLFLIAGVRLQYRFAAEPHLVFVEHRIKYWTLNDHPSSFAQVAVANERPDGSCDAAKHVYPNITVLDADGAAVLCPKQIARWSSKPEPALNPRLNVHDPALTQWDEIPPNGDRYYIDTIAKYDDADECYVWTNQGSVEGTHVIHARTFLVEIEMRASNLAEKPTQRFRLTHGGPGSHLTIDRA